MTNPDLKLCTTFELQHIIKGFRYYDSRFVKRVEKELFRRQRIQFLKEQTDKLFKKHNSYK